MSEPTQPDQLQPTEKDFGTQQPVDGGELVCRLVDMLDAHFPKDKSEERGQAMVLVAELLRWHQAAIQQAEVSAQLALLDRLQRHAYLEQQPYDQNALRANVIRVAHLNNECRRLQAHQPNPEGDNNV